MIINSHTYRKLVQGDIDWLKTVPQTLERDHILLILEHQIRDAEEIVARDRKQEASLREKMANEKVPHVPSVKDIKTFFEPYEMTDEEIAQIEERRAHLAQNPRIHKEPLPLRDDQSAPRQHPNTRGIS